MERTQDYRSRIYKAYSRTHYANREGAPVEPPDYSSRVHARQFGPLLPADRKARILELGCGTGVFLYSLRKQGFKSVVGLEQDPDQAARARRLCPDAAVEQADALEFLASRKGEFDCVVAIDFLEHFRKDELFCVLDAIKASLRPGGIMVGRVPNADGLFPAGIRYGDLTHELAFTPSSIHQIFSAAGFKAARSFAEEPVPTGLRSALRWLLWQPMKAAIRLALFVQSYGHRGAVLTPNLLFRAEL